MPARICPGPIPEDAALREAVCVHTKKIYDSCRDKDCLEDLTFYPTTESQCVLSTALSVRGKSAELLLVTMDVEELTFNRGHYAVDLRYFYKITGEAFTSSNCGTEICGLSVFDKKVILFGSEGSAKVFTSGSCPQTPGDLTGANRPTAVVEAVDPVLLGMRLTESSCGCQNAAPSVLEIPDAIAPKFPGGLTIDTSARQVYVTLGQFSIIRLERDSNLLIPAYDYCMPEKECVGCGDDDPCALFRRIDFPVDEFFPPDTLSCPEGYREALGTVNHR